MANIQEILEGNVIITKKKEHIFSVIMRFSKNIIIFVLLLIIISYILLANNFPMFLVIIIDLLLIVWMVFYIKLFYDNTFLIITSSKIVKSVRSWLFSSHVIELPLERIRQVRANNNWICAKICGYWDIEIQGFEESSNMYFRAMKWNKETMSDICKLLSDVKKN